MERFFNTAGPVDPEIHYCIDPLKRIDLSEVLRLVAQRKYFVLHAPRQTGKTSALLALMKRLNAEGLFQCLYINVESAQSARNDVGQAMRSIVSEFGMALSNQGSGTHTQEICARIGQAHSAINGFSEVSAAWARECARPAVLLIDEIDSLVGDSLISVLRQVRAGYVQRPVNFPQSIILCGVRDVRDYRIRQEGQDTITGGSAFNIKAESLRVGDFSAREVADLLRMHTTATGQVFDDDAIERICTLTNGQPWLVNALAYEICFREGRGRDRSMRITAGMVDGAKEALILRRDTHLDQLADKLREDRVRRVIAPILAGETDPEQIPTDDVSYVQDLGLIRARPHLAISNPIYQEVIPRELTSSTQETITH